MEIEKVSKLSKINKPNSISHISDTVAIRAPDISQWVEELKAMPDIRMEKVAAVRAQPSLNELAHAIAQEIA